MIQELDDSILNAISNSLDVTMDADDDNDDDDEKEEMEDLNGMTETLFETVSKIESVMTLEREGEQSFCARKKKNVAIFMTGSDVIGNISDFRGEIRDDDDEDGRYTH